MGVFEAHESPRPEFLGRLLRAKDPRVRAYGARVAGMWAERLPEAIQWLSERVLDEHPRVRLEAVVATSYLKTPAVAAVMTRVLESPMDKFLEYALRQSARATLSVWRPALEAEKLVLREPAQTRYLRQLLDAPSKIVSAGETLYEMACLPCHQPGGKGLPSVYPPLLGSDWVTGSKERLIKVALQGLSGPIEVSGREFAGENLIPMPGMAGLNDEQLADVLTFIRREFGGGATPVDRAEVHTVRAATASRDRPWTAAELR
jgi:mono/diheme cytochrome c family protein